MPLEKLVATLKKHHFVDEFQPQHIEKLATMAREVEFQPDQIIFREGDDCHDFYLIVRGSIALEIAAPSYTFRVQNLKAGDELGWSAMLMGRGKHFQARALEPVEALALNGEEVLAACRDDKAFGYALMYRMLGVVSERLQATRLQLIDNFSPVAKRAGA